MLREAGRVTVEESATRFGTTPQTIRRDFNELADALMIVRLHGGAMATSSETNLAYEARELIAGPHEWSIGEAAAKLVPDDANVLLAIGTTAKRWHAPKGHSSFLVVTNNLQVAAELYRSTAIAVIAGGVRCGEGDIVGPIRSRSSRSFASTSR